MTVTSPTVDLRVESPPKPPAQVVLGPPARVRRTDPRPTPTRAGRPARAAAGRRPTRLEVRAQRLVHALVEVVDGNRPASQLAPLATRAVHEELVARLASLAAATSRGSRVPALSTSVASVHVGQPHNACAEISARIVQGGRSRALALRLERVDDRWLCSALRWG